MLGVKEEFRRPILKVVNQRSAQHLMPILQKHVRQGSTVVSDGWRAYNGLRDAGYNHLTVNHKEVFVDPQTGAHTQNIERLWGVCKATVWRCRGNRTESRLKDHLKVIEWTYWRGDIHKNGPLGMILHDIRRKYPVWKDVDVQFILWPSSSFVLKTNLSINCLAIYCDYSRCVSSVCSLEP